jgi:DnaJ-class molecular chaperone
LRLKFPGKFTSFSEPELKSVSNPIYDPSCPSRDENPTDLKPYREQTLIFHPDKNPKCKESANIKFLQLKKIFEIEGGRKRSNKKRNNKKRTNKKRSNKKRTNKKRSNKK